MRKSIEWRARFVRGQLTTVNSIEYILSAGRRVRVPSNLRDFQRDPQKYFSQDVSMFTWGDVTSSPPQGVWLYSKFIEQGE